MGLSRSGNGHHLHHSPMTADTIDTMPAWLVGAATGLAGTTIAAVAVLVVAAHDRRHTPPAPSGATIHPIRRIPHPQCKAAR